MEEVTCLGGNRSMKNLVHEVYQFLCKCFSWRKTVGLNIRLNIFHLLLLIAFLSVKNNHCLSEAFGVDICKTTEKNHEIFIHPGSGIDIWYERKMYSFEFYVGFLHLLFGYFWIVSTKRYFQILSDWINWYHNYSTRHLLIFLWFNEVQSGSYWQTKVIHMAVLMLWGPLWLTGILSQSFICPSS